MLARADTALDLGALELVLHALGVGVVLLLLGLLLPVGRGPEDDVFADGRGVAGWAGRVVGRQAELGPLLALGDARVDDLAVGDEADAPCRLDRLALVIQAVGDDGLGAVAVLDGLVWGQSGGDGLVVLIVIGPVARRQEGKVRWVSGRGRFKGKAWMCWWRDADVHHRGHTRLPMRLARSHRSCLQRWAGKERGRSSAARAEAYRAVLLLVIAAMVTDHTISKTICFVSVDAVREWIGRV